MNCARYNGTVMAAVVELRNTGDLTNRSDIVASIEHALCEEPGDWQISIVGSRSSDGWEMKVEGPRGFERWLRRRSKPVGGRDQDLPLRSR
jgi:hypothetical protein